LLFAVVIEDGGAVLLPAINKLTISIITGT